MENLFGKYSRLAHTILFTGRYLLLFAILLLTTVSSCKSKKEAPALKKEAPAPVATKDNLQEYYTCPMHPQVVSDKPGKDPICGMTLIKVTKSVKAGSDEVVLNNLQMLLGNIKVDSISNAMIGDKIYLTGTLNFNLYKLVAVSSRVMGRIEKLYFKNIGDYVQKGDRLFDIYSEELNNIKQEYIVALQQKATLSNTMIDYNRVVEAARYKLELWGLSPSQINEIKTTLKSSRLTPFYSPASGYITNLNLKEGDYSRVEGGTIVQLADLSTLWAEAQAYTSQLSELDRNGIANVQVPDMPGKVFQGRIQYVNPEVNPETRVNLIRVEIPNSDHRLKPGMPAYVIMNSTQHKSFTLPIDAVLRDDKGAIVWVRTGYNTFALRMVKVGLETSDRIEILSGLKPGDIVVTSGSYLLNSEYKFKVGTSDPMAGMKM